MNDKTPTSDTDIDDSEILEKFNGLLNKYQNQGKSAGLAKKNKSTLPATPSRKAPPLFKPSETIPTLTEAVTLRPAVIQRQPKRSTPIQKILDAALEEAGIAMPPHDRKALANALAARLMEKTGNKTTVD